MIMELALSGGAKKHSMRGAVSHAKVEGIKGKLVLMRAGFALADDEAFGFA